MDKNAAKTELEKTLREIQSGIMELRTKEPGLPQFGQLTKLSQERQAFFDKKLTSAGKEVISYAGKETSRP